MQIISGCLFLSLFFLSQTSFAISICSQTLAPASTAITIRESDVELRQLLELDSVFVRQNRHKLFALVGEVSSGKTFLTDDLKKRLARINHPTYWGHQAGLTQSFTTKLPKGDRLVTMPMSRDDFYATVTKDLEHILKNRKLLPHNTIVIVDTCHLFTNPNQSSYLVSSKNVLPMWLALLDLAATGQFIATHFLFT